MSEKPMPKTGDRVRVVLEGEVTDVHSVGFAVGRRGGNCDYIYPPAEHVVSVEILPPPPPEEPPVGSVVLDQDGDAWQRKPRGWVLAGGVGVPLSWESLHPSLALRIIHRGGAS